MAARRQARQDILSRLKLRPAEPVPRLTDRRELRELLKHGKPDNATKTLVVRQPTLASAGYKQASGSTIHLGDRLIGPGTYVSDLELSPAIHLRRLAIQQSWDDATRDKRRRGAVAQMTQAEQKYDPELNWQVPDLADSEFDIRVDNRLSDEDVFF